MTRPGGLAARAPSPEWCRPLGPEASARAKYIKDTLWMVLTGRESLSERQRAGLEKPAAIYRPLHHAYLLQDQLGEAIRTGGEAGCALFAAWIGRARESKLPHTVEAAQRVADHLDGIHAAPRHRITNARIETFNTRLQMINRRAYGFHGAQALIALAVLDLGKLCPPCRAGHRRPRHVSEEAGTAR